MSASELTRYALDVCANWVRAGDLKTDVGGWQEALRIACDAHHAQREHRAVEGHSAWRTGATLDGLLNPLGQLVRHAGADEVGIVGKLDKAVHPSGGDVVHADGDDALKALPRDLLVAL